MAQQHLRYGNATVDAVLSRCHCDECDAVRASLLSTSTEVHLQTKFVGDDIRHAKSKNLDEALHALSNGLAEFVYAKRCPEGGCTGGVLGLYKPGRKTSNCYNYK